MMDRHRSEHPAILSEAFHPAFFSIAECLRCPEQRYCNGLTGKIQVLPSVRTPSTSKRMSLILRARAVADNLGIAAILAGCDLARARLLVWGRAPSPVQV